MGNPIRVLILEDSANDAALLVRQLQVGGYDQTYGRVETAQALRVALTTQTWDVILADYSLPSFNALNALALLPELGLDLPFIVLSGTINEATAVSALKAGAHNFIVKGNWARLGPAIARELREAEVRQQRRQAEDRLRLTDEILRRIQSLVILTDRNGAVTYVSEASRLILGYSPAELLGEQWWQATYDDPAAAAADREGVARAARGEISPSTEPYEKNIKTRTGATSWLLWQVAQGPSDTLIAIGHDITERKLRVRERELEAMATLSAALRAAPARAEMLPIILQQVLALLKADGAALGILDPASGETVVELGIGSWADEAGIRIPAGQTVLAEVIAGGRPYAAGAAQLDPRYFGKTDVSRIGSVAIVPLITQSQTVGALWIGRDVRFGDGETRLLSGIANIAANALQRATLYEETERNLRRLAALRAIDTAISSSLDLRVTLNILVEQVVTQLRVDAADVLLLDSVSRTLEYAAGRGFRSPVAGHSRWQASQGYAGRLVVERRTISLPDLSAAEPDPLRAAGLAHENFQAYSGAPLIAKGRVVGVIEIFHRAPLHPDADWLSFLEALTKPRSRAGRGRWICGIRRPRAIPNGRRS